MGRERRSDVVRSQVDETIVRAGLSQRRDGLGVRVRGIDEPDQLDDLGRLHQRPSWRSCTARSAPTRSVAPASCTGRGRVARAVTFADGARAATSSAHQPRFAAKPPSLVGSAILRRTTVSTSSTGTSSPSRRRVVPQPCTRSRSKVLSGRAASTLRQPSRSASTRPINPGGNGSGNGPPRTGGWGVSGTGTGTGVPLGTSGSGTGSGYPARGCARGVSQSVTAASPSPSLVTGFVTGRDVTCASLVTGGDVTGSPSPRSDPGPSLAQPSPARFSRSRSFEVGGLYSSWSWTS